MLVLNAVNLRDVAPGKAIRISTLLMLALSISFPAIAQFQASLRGTVTDSTGAVIPGVTVTLINDETNQALTTQSNGAGIYSFNGLA
ncbi:MAG: carboxypeptidase-like regulatory domain-containing protein, partial [Terracidiphilus sp.]